MLTLGIDLSADPKKTACCWIDWSHREVRVLRRTLTDDELVAEIATADVTGIDVPLAWPSDFVDAVVAHRDGRPWPAADGDRAPLRLRSTDRALKRLGAHPLSVSSDRIGAAAMRGAHLQSLLRSTGIEVDRSGRSGRLVEAYPAATLANWGLRSRSYKGSDNREALAELARDLSARCGPISATATAALDGCNDDELDAFVCSLVARATRLGLTTLPGDAEAAAARSEGWIHVPTVSIEDLVARGIT